MAVFGMQHVGFTVPDMDQAVRFFEEVFGAITLMSTGPLSVDNDFMARKLGVPPNARISDIKVLRIGTGTNLELFTYEGDPGASEALKRNSQPGGFHLAFQVDDAVATADKMRANGIDVLDGPTFIDSGPFEGLTWVYLRTPWGQYLELVSMNGPLGFERDGGPRAWSPVAGT